MIHASSCSKISRDFNVDEMVPWRWLETKRRCRAVSWRKMSRACVRASHTTGRDKLILSCADDLISSFVVSCYVVSCACVSSLTPLGQDVSSVSKPCRI